MLDHGDAGSVLRLVCARQLARSTRRRALNCIVRRGRRGQPRGRGVVARAPSAALPPGGGFATADHGELAAGRPHALAALARLGSTSSPPHARWQRAGDVDGGASCCLAREFRRAVLSRLGGWAAVWLRPNCPTTNHQHHSSAAPLERAASARPASWPARLCTAAHLATQPGRRSAVQGGPPEAPMRLGRSWKASGGRLGIAPLLLCCCVGVCFCVFCFCFFSRFALCLCVFLGCVFLFVVVLGYGKFHGGGAMRAPP